MVNCKQNLTQCNSNCGGPFVLFFAIPRQSDMTIYILSLHIFVSLIILLLLYKVLYVAINLANLNK